MAAKRNSTPNNPHGVGLDHLDRFDRRRRGRQQTAVGRFFSAGRFRRGDEPLPDLWWLLACITSCGILAAALIMEFTKIFVSTNSRHVQEVTTASDQGGASLNILSGLSPEIFRHSGWV